MNVGRLINELLSRDYGCSRYVFLIVIKCLVMVQKGMKDCLFNYDDLHTVKFLYWNELE